MLYPTKWPKVGTASPSQSVRQQPPSPVQALAQVRHFVRSTSPRDDLVRPESSPVSNGEAPDTPAPFLAAERADRGRSQSPLVVRRRSASTGALRKGLGGLDPAHIRTASESAQVFVQAPAPKQCAQFTRANVPSGEMSRSTSFQALPIGGSLQVPPLQRGGSLQVPPVQRPASFVGSPPRVCVAPPSHRGSLHVSSPLVTPRLSVRQRPPLLWSVTQAPLAAHGAPRAVPVSTPLRSAPTLPRTWHVVKHGQKKEDARPAACEVGLRQATGGARFSIPSNGQVVYSGSASLAPSEAQTPRLTPKAGTPAHMLASFVASPRSATTSSGCGARANEDSEALLTQRSRR